MTSIQFSDEVFDALSSGAHLLVSVSGGKDSDCMAIRVVQAHRQQGWQGDIALIHADVGRMEWQQSLPHCRQLAARLGVPLYVVEHSKYDLLDRIRDRMQKRPDAPPFPSSAARYCTAEFKRETINRFIRQRYPKNARCVVAIGIRAEESRSRAKKPISAMRGASALTKNRVVLDWHPIHAFTLEDVWSTLGYTLEHLSALQGIAADYLRKGYLVDEVVRLVGFSAHPAYLLGNERVSCSMCVLASANDLANGAREDAKLYRALCYIEIKSGFSFRHGMWIGALQPDLLTRRQRLWYEWKGVL